MPWRGVALITATGHFCLFYWTGDASRVRQEGAPTEIIEYAYDDLFLKVREKLLVWDIRGGQIAVDMALPGNAQPAPGMLTAQEYLELTEILPGYRIVNGVGCLDRLWERKGKEELERMRKAGEIADYAFEKALHLLRPGDTENHLAGILEAACRDAGSFWSWSVTANTEVGSGERTAFAHGVSQIASEKRIRENEFLILDFHPSYELYLCDFSVPVFLGEPNKEQRKLIDCWEEAVETVFRAIHPGVRICDVVSEGVNVYRRYGLYEYCLPRFGHGLGVCARTGPALNLSNQQVFQTGMTFAMGAHLYQPGVGGLRLEYPVAVGKKDAEQLAKTPMKVHIVPLNDR